MAALRKPLSLKALRNKVLSTVFGLGLVWSPSLLFANNEVGAWYDPSDLDRYMSGLGTEGSPALSEYVTALTGTWAASGANYIFTDTVGGQSRPGVQYPTTSLVAGWYRVVVVVAAINGATQIRMDGVGATDQLLTVGTNTYTLNVTSTSRPRFRLEDLSTTIGDSFTITSISIKEVTSVSSATMYQDSAGTTPVTAVEQPVGLLLDKSKGLALGSETVINGDCSSSTGWISGGAGWTITGGQLVMTAATSSGIVYQQYSDGRLTAGKTYKVTFDIVSVSAGSARIDLWGATTANGVYFSTNGTKTCYIVAPSAPVGMQFTVSGPFTGTIDNISVRELPGNHASQSTAASRPVLSARVNLLTYSEQFDNAAWTPNAQGTGVTPTRTASAGTDPNGGNTATRLQVSRSGTATTDRSGIYQIATAVSANTDHTAAVWLKSYSGATQKIVLYANWGAGLATEVTVTNTWQRCSISLNTGASTAARLDIGLGFAVSTETSADILLWGADLRVTNVGVNLPTYQRVAAATDYDTSGFPLYLKFDGVDDSLATGTIDFTATDKMSVFAGIRKLSDTTQATVAELSVSASGNNGSFYLAAPNGAAGNYIFAMKGSVPQNFSITPSTYSAPRTDVLTGVGDISGDLVQLRVSGTAITADTDDNGTGNFLSYPLYIGRRGGSSFPFNGNLYSLIVRGALSTDAQIASTETYVNSKTGAY